MPVIDLTRYIVAEAGTWTDPRQDDNLFQFMPADTKSPDRLLLRWAGDFVALTGPLSISVTVQAENMTVPLALVGNLAPTFAGTSPATLSEAVLTRFAGSGALNLQASTIYSYTLDIPAGQAWPFSLSEQLEALRYQTARASRFDQLGNNLGYRVIIEPAFAIPKLHHVTTTSDLPCDFAVADQPNSASFFPVACEPCQGSVIGLPHTGGVSLVTPPAEGGCVRTRFFNGMFITREDLETEQRYHRLKSKLHNRAAGAGVVWGLAVAKRSSAICVAPGYGVDCCGNDLALTTMYHVDIAALLADPAAAPYVRRHGAQRMSLLLEYVECPSDPRPVHGDPCSPQTTQCEMSRIRESMRLRLVPPRDYDPGRESKPIKWYLDEVRRIRQRYPINVDQQAATAGRAPFVVRITGSGTGNVSNASVTVRPTVGSQQVNLPVAGGRSRITSFTVAVQPDQAWTFIGGTLTGRATSRSGGNMTTAVTPSDTIDLSLAQGFNLGAREVTFSLANAEQRLQRVTVNLADWQAQNLLAGQDTPAPSGNLSLTVELNERGQLAEQGTLALEMSVGRLSLADDPCDGEPCGTVQFRSPDREADPCLDPYARENPDPTPYLPWLHEDPIHPGHAGDPKALIFEALVAWLAPMLVRERVGTSEEVLTSRGELVRGIYQVAWLLLFGVPAEADSRLLGGSLRRLLEGLCDELLWKGPQCCGEPHGVVIGCAVVESGTIQSIDPFGGRRHVIHYPLIEHWGAQFGLAPPDLMVSRLFSKLCCLGSLAPIQFGDVRTPGQLIQVGGGYVWVGDPRELNENLAKNRAVIVDQRDVGIPEMIASAVTLIGSRRPPSDSDQRTQYTALVLADIVAEQTVMLLLPADS